MRSENADKNLFWIIFNRTPTKNVYFFTKIKNLLSITRNLKISFKDRRITDGDKSCISKLKITNKNLFYLIKIEAIQGLNIRDPGPLAESLRFSYNTTY